MRWVRPFLLGVVLCAASGRLTRFAWRKVFQGTQKGRIIRELYVAYRELADLSGEVVDCATDSLHGGAIAGYRCVSDCFADTGVYLRQRWRDYQEDYPF